METITSNALEQVSNKEASSQGTITIGLEHAESRMIPLISVVLPVHNEAKTVRSVVNRYFTEISGKLPLEFIVAEDGSSDGTREILSSMKSEIPFTLISDQDRKGYARGVADALRRCGGEWIFFSDADGQFSPSDFWNLWRLHERYDMIVGIKVHRRDAIHRIILAKGFRWLVNRIFHLNLHDSDSGYRLIRRDVVSALIHDVKFLEYSFWIEFTIRACRRGFRTCEMPVAHRSREYGESRIFRPLTVPTVVLKQLNGLVKLYWNLKLDARANGPKLVK